MHKKRLFHLLTLFWLGIAAVCLLGHHLADAASLGCQVNITGVCLAEENSTNFQTPGENAPSVTALHAGFDLPSVTSVKVGPALALATVVLILMPVAVNPPPLSPPPQ